jgi:hypothetical protein
MVRLSAGIAATIFLLALYAFCSVFVYRVAVRNQTAVTLTNVQIIMPSGTLWTGTLNPGESHAHMDCREGTGSRKLLTQQRDAHSVKESLM